MIASMSFNLKGKTLRNRFVAAPFKTGLGNTDGSVSDSQIKFFSRIAEGGVALVLGEPIAVSFDGREHPRQLMLNDENFDSFKSFVASVKEKGALFGAHLNHAGRAANPKVIGKKPLAPSSIQCPSTGAIPDELSKNEIQRIIEDYRKTATLCKKANVDFIEIQMGHGYLVHQFYSKKLNKRNDEYGGTIENRLRFAREVLTTVKSAADGIPIIVRLSASEFIKDKDSITPESLEPLIKLLESENIAALHLGFGNACDNPAWYYQHMALPEEQKIEAVKKIRGITDIPLILVGRMSEEEKIEDLLSNKTVDLVAMARPLVADPYLPMKILQKDDERFLCGGCLQGCLMNVKSGKAIGCIINPTTDKFEKLEKTDDPKKILVIGGGPAGMMAALTLSKRGYETTLVDSSDELGGQFKYAILAPGKQRMSLPLKSLVKATEKHVKIIRNTEADIDFVKSENPDHVIVATGADPLIIKFKGLDTINWITGIEALQRNNIKNVRVLVVGGGLIGMEVAEKLIEAGNEVDVIEIRSKVGIGMEPITEKLMWKRLEGKNLNIYTETSIQSFENGDVIVKDLKTEEIKNLGKYELVVMATGTTSNKSIVEELEKEKIPFDVVGDAKELNQIIGAVRSAYEIAAKL